MQAAIDEPPDIAVPLAMDARLTHTGPPPGQANMPRLSNATYWWLQVDGSRRSPASRPAQVQANLENVFQQHRARGLDAYLAGAHAGSRGRPRPIGTGPEIPRLLVDSGSHGVYDVRTDGHELGDDPERRRCRWCC